MPDVVSKYKHFQSTRVFLMLARCDAGIDVGVHLFPVVGKESSSWRNEEGINFSLEYKRILEIRLEALQRMGWNIVSTHLLMLETAITHRVD